MFATLQTRNRYSLALVLLLAASIGGCEGQTITKEISSGVYVLLAGESESCTNACSRSGFTCSDASLEAAADYCTASKVIETVSAIGGNCALVKGERDGKPFPLIDARHWCYASPSGRTNYDCDFTSTMTQPGRRICSCFGEPGATSSPLPVPRASPTSSPTASPTASPVASPTVAQTASPTPAPSTNNNEPRSSPFVPSGYSLSWRDDFDGPDLNTTNWSRGLVYDEDPSQHVVWNPRTGGPHLLNTNYHGYILDEDTYIEDGKLVLANREHNPPLSGTAPEGSFQYSTGWVNSLRKRYYNGSKKGSYLEARARFPSGLKVWPAIWLVSESLIWPPEIDVWEYFGCFFNPRNRVDEMHLRNIWGEWPNGKVTHNFELVDFQEHWSGYLTLGWLWTSQEMIWYIDGNPVATKSRGVDIPYEDWPNEDFFLILNNGLMREIDGSTTNFPNFFEIDYIALYEASDDVEPPVAQYVVLLGEAGESCTSACSRNGLTCSTRSLLHGDEYTTRSEIAATAAAVGVNCAGGVHREKDWDVNPQVSADNYCFPIPSDGRSNQNCNGASTLVDSNGELQGHRICSCESFAIM